MKLNLASGQRPFPKPWVNIDVKEQGYEVDILTDVKSLPMIESDSVDVIVAHHLVEHIAIHELTAYLTEWRRVLKTGGILSVHVPNIREINRAWLDGRIDAFIHNVNVYGAYQNSIHDLHKWGYDEKELDARFTNDMSWECRPYNRHNPLYDGADIAEDWWILNREYVKNA